MVPEEGDRLALEYDDKGTGAVPAERDCRHDPQSVVEIATHLEQTVIEE